MGPFERPYLPTNYREYIVKEKEGNYGVIHESGKWMVEPKYTQDIRFNKVSAWTVLPLPNGNLEMMNYGLTSVEKALESVQILHEKEGKSLCMKKEGEKYFLVLYTAYFREVWRKEYEGESLTASRFMGGDALYLPPKDAYDPWEFYPSEHVYMTHGRKPFPNMKVRLDSSWARTYWVRFANRMLKMQEENSIVGDRLFAEVIPGRRPFDLVKTKSGWRLYNAYQDSLYAGRFERVKHFDVRSGMITFGKSREDGLMGWGLANMNGKVVLDPIYDEVDPRWVEGVITFYQGENRVLVNAKGKVIFKEIPRTANGNTLNLTTRYRMPTYVREAQPIESVKGLKKQLKSRENVKLYLNPQRRKLSSGVSGYTLMIGNPSEKDVPFNSQDSRIEVYLEANVDGVWKQITHFPNSWCGNSYYNVSLKAGHYWTLEVPHFNGEKPVMVRAKLLRKTGELGSKEEFVSEQIPMSINPGQTWIIPISRSGGLMNPYVD